MLEQRRSESGEFSISWTGTKLETDEDIKAGKQGKLDVALFSKNSGASSVSTILLAYQKKTPKIS
jgi:hypothetical protein